MDLRITAVATGADGAAVTASVTVAVDVPARAEGPVRRLAREAEGIIEKLEAHGDGR